jgi:DNA polymerase-3 subunit gamma/tau
MLSGHSFNALLKTLEEPPPHVKFLLATTDPQKIPVTVLSRCLQFNLKRLLPEQIDKQMTFILEQEKIKAEPAAITLLSRSADGSLRDGLSLLDQAISFGNGEVQLDTVNQMLGTVAQQPVDEILLALADNDAVELMQKIATIAELTPDFSEILQQVLRVLHRVSMTQVMTGFIDKEFDPKMIAQLSERLLPEDVQLFYQIGLIGQRDLDLAPDPRCGFEMVMLRMLTFKPEQNKVTQGTNQATSSEERSKKKLPVEKAPIIKTESLNKVATEIKEPSAPVKKENNNWSEIVIAMNLVAMTRELANNCVLEIVDETHCYLILDPGHIQLKSPSAEKKLQNAIQGYYGKPLKLVIKTERKERASATPAQQITQGNEDRQQAAVDAINDDENVKALKDQLGARILPGSIEPI